MIRFDRLEFDEAASRYVCRATIQRGEPTVERTFRGSIETIAKDSAKMISAMGLPWSVAFAVSPGVSRVAAEWNLAKLINSELKKLRNVEWPHLSLRQKADADADSDSFEGRLQRVNDANNPRVGELAIVGAGFDFGYWSLTCKVFVDGDGQEARYVVTFAGKRPRDVAADVVDYAGKARIGRLLLVNRLTGFRRATVDFLIAEEILGQCG